MKNSDEEIGSEKETIRVEAFSDGVFAIAITLLILEIHVPEFEEGESLFSALAHEWASIVAFFIGFFTILICWINHHFMFRYIYKSDSMLLLINGLKLLVVTATPFATALLAKSIETDWQQQSVNIYCFNFALMGIAMSGIWSYANSKGFTKASSREYLRSTTWLYYFAGLFSTVIFAISFWNVFVCLGLSAVMFVIFLFPKRAVTWRLGRIKSKLVLD